MPEAPGSTRMRGAPTASTTSCGARRRNDLRTITTTNGGLKASVYLVRKFLSQIHPFALRGELLVGLPVGARIARLAVLLQRHRQVEMRVGVRRVQLQ